MNSRARLEALGNEIRRVKELLEAFKEKQDIMRVSFAQQALRHAERAFHEGDADLIELSIIDLKGFSE